MRKQQKGFAIVTVLMVLIVTLALAVTTTRMAITSNYQSSLAMAKRIIQNENDVALYYLSRTSDAATKNSSTGMFGVASATANADREIIFCMPAQVDSATTFFSTSARSMKSFVAGTAPTNHATAGFCKLGTTNNLNSPRKLTLTQIAVFYDSTITPQSLGGSETDTQKVYRVTVTTAMPRLSKATNTTINNCFANQMNNIANIKVSGSTHNSVAVCLKNAGVPVASDVTLLKF